MIKQVFSLSVFKNNLAFSLFPIGFLASSLTIVFLNILAQFFGNNVYLWISFLSLSGIFFSLGFLSSQFFHARKNQFLSATFLFVTSLLSALSLLLITFNYAGVFLKLFYLEEILLSLLLSVAVPTGVFIFLGMLSAGLVKDIFGKRNLFKRLTGVLFLPLGFFGLVTGVFLSLWVFIPSISNAMSILLLSLVFFGLALIYKFKRYSFLVTFLGLSLFVSLIFFEKKIFPPDGDYLINGKNFKIVTEIKGFMKNIKLLKTSLNAPENSIHTFLFNNLPQFELGKQSEPLLVKDYVLTKLISGFGAEKQKALVVGLASGFVAQDLKNKGFNVTILEKNEALPDLLNKVVGFVKNDFSIKATDLNAYFSSCDKQFDVVVLDFFKGDDAVDKMLSLGSFQSLKKCLSPKGVVVMSASYLGSDKISKNRVLTVFAGAFTNIFEFYLLGEEFFVVATNNMDNHKVYLKVADTPLNITSQVETILNSWEYHLGSDFKPEDIQKTKYGSFEFFTKKHIEYRKSVFKYLPRDFLR